MVVAPARPEGDREHRQEGNTTSNHRHFHSAFVDDCDGRNEKSDPKKTNGGLVVHSLVVAGASPSRYDGMTVFSGIQPLLSLDVEYLLTDCE